MVLIASIQPQVKAAEESASISGDQKPPTQIAGTKQTFGGNSELQQKLADLNEQSVALITNKSDVDSAAASLLKRAKAAEAQCEELKKQLAQLMSSISEGSFVPKAASNTVGSPGAVPRKPAAGPAAAATAGVGANPVEFKKLQKRVKELETQLAAAQGDGGVDKKAVAALEKKYQKQLKDQETDLKKASKSLETKAVQAAKDLAQVTTSLTAITAERDTLKKKVSEMQTLLNEMGELRAKAEQLAVMKEEIKTKDAEIERLGEQYKKESALRKKYKNELEDLKGAIRVYARCRPFAKYEIEKNCQSVVTFKDETTVAIANSRGEKTFEFDAAFNQTSTQDQIFEDTKRLVESCLDGFNVCVFAYGQTGSGRLLLLL